MPHIFNRKVTTPETAAMLAEALQNLENGQVSFADMAMMNGTIVIHDEPFYDPLADELFICAVPVGRVCHD